jgi:hypothetical protein
MKYFKQFFTFLFIVSIFVGVVHELFPDHHHDDTCEICLVAHTPALLNDAVALPSITTYFEPFYATFSPISYKLDISLKSRSPPLS